MKEFVEKLIGRLEEKAKIEGEKCDKFAEMNMCESVVKYNHGEYCYIDAIKIVNQLAEEYNNGWIPVSDRLPEANQKVLTCDKDGWISVNVNMPYIGVRNDFECGYYVAWMPLPAPYQKGEYL